MADNEETAGLGQRRKPRTVDAPLPVPMPSYLDLIDRLHEQRKRDQGIGGQVTAGTPQGYAFGGSPWGVASNVNHMIRGPGVGPQPNSGMKLSMSAVPGRTDQIPRQSRPGAYILPADVVSGAGQGNTMAGAKMWMNMIHTSAYGAGPPPKMRGGLPRPSMPRPPRPAPMMHMAPLRKIGAADGGEMGASADEQPILLAGGELEVAPELVEAIGGWDMDVGRRALDKAVVSIRKQTIADMLKLPGPKK